MNKPRKQIEGRLYLPLKAGEKAIVIQGAYRLITSTVMSVIEESATRFVFETRNTIYDLTLERVTEPISCSLQCAEA